MGGSQRRSVKLTQSLVDSLSFEFLELNTFVTKSCSTPIYVKLITVEKLSYYSIFTWNVS